ncbi:MAG TPA: hypothetical protein VJP88_00505 [Caulobacteraceae bacterium]|nr:hypothetical protein [Caulobacteraceae bacterium]
MGEGVEKLEYRLAVESAALRDCNDERKAALAQVEALRKALEPFARFHEAMEHMGGTFPKAGEWYGLDSRVTGERKLMVEDFARARAALASSTPESAWDENAQRSYSAQELKALLDQRDAFIVRSGLWGAFVAELGLTPESAVYPQRDMASAPRDGTPILAVVGVASERWEHLNGRSFVIRHEGKTASGYDLGWSVYPGLGGVSDDWFACWTPLPAPAEARSDPLDTPLPCDVEVAHIRFRKGVALRTFVNAARRWHAKASAAEKTDPEKLAEFKAWFERKVEIEGNDLVSVGVGLAGPDLCAHDGRPCYVSAGTDDAHWRCGTSACPGSQSVGSDQLTRDA